MRRTIVAFLLSLCFIQAYAKNPPEALYNAKTAILVNGGAQAKDFDKFREYLEKWGRFEFVKEREAADIIIKLRAKAGSLTMRTPDGGVAPTVTVIVNYYEITTAKEDESMLWSDETPGESKDTRILVIRLQQKLKKK